MIFLNLKNITHHLQNWVTIIFIHVHYWGNIKLQFFGNILIPKKPLIVYNITLITWRLDSSVSSSVEDKWKSDLSALCRLLETEQKDGVVAESKKASFMNFVTNSWRWNVLPFFKISFLKWGKHFSRIH